MPLFVLFFKTPNNWDPPVPANYNLVAYVSSVLYSLRHAFINDFQIPLTPNLIPQNWNSLHNTRKIKNMSLSRRTRVVPL